MGIFSNIFGKKKTPDERYMEAVQREIKGDKQFALQTYIELINEKHMDGDYHLPYQRAIYILQDRKQWSKIIETCDLYEKRYHPWGDDHWHHSFRSSARFELDKQKQTNQPKQPVQQPAQQPQPQPENTDKGWTNQPPPPKPIQPAPKPTIRNPYPTQANWKSEQTEKENYVTSMTKAIAMLPEFNCYANGKQPENIPANASKLINEIKKIALNQLLDAEEAEEKRNYIKATEIYEAMVTMKYWDEEPYEKLFQIYKKANLKDECIKLADYVVTYFETLESREKEKVLQLAAKYGCQPQYQDMIEKGQEVVYYMGLYKLYSPRPWIQKWKDRLL